MPSKRPLSDLFSEDVIIVLISCTDTAAKALRHEHNAAYLYDDRPNFSTSRQRADRDSTPQYDLEPMAKIILKFSNKPCTSEGFTFGSDPQSCNILIDNNPRRGISRTHFYLSFDRMSRALLLTDTSSHCTVLTTQTFPKKDDESRILNAGQHELSHNSLVLSEGDEIRAGVVVLKVVVLRRPEPDTRVWSSYINRVDIFMQQCDKNPKSSQQERNSDVATVVDSTTLGWLGTAGKGSYAKVLKMIDSRGFLYGVKIPLHQGLGDIVQKELEYLKTIRHEHIVSVVEDKTPPFEGPAIVMEYIPMTLQRFSSSSMPYTPLKLLMEQLMDALDHLHAHSIAHRDIKPSNILIKSVDPIVSKLADMGISSAAKTMKPFCGTLMYKAPEISSKHQQEGTPYDAKIDVWSAGVVLAEYSLPERYFETRGEDAGLSDAGIISSIMQIQNAKQAFKGLLQRMLVREPQKRASSRGCLEAIRQLPEMSESGTMAKAAIELAEETGELSPTLPLTAIVSAAAKLTRPDPESHLILNLKPATPKQC